MINFIDQPALKLVECTEPNLTQVELPALVRFECAVKLPKTNTAYKKLHDVVTLRFGSHYIEVSGGVNFSIATPKLLTQEEVSKVEQLISDEVSTPFNLRKYNLLYFPSNIASPRLEVERIEPIIEPDQSNPLKFKCLFKLISKTYLIKEYLGKEDYKELFLYAQKSRFDDFQKGKKVKFEKLKIVPIWAKIREAQVI